MNLKMATIFSRSQCVHTRGPMFVGVSLSGRLWWRLLTVRTVAIRILAGEVDGPCRTPLFIGTRAPFQNKDRHSIYNEKTFVRTVCL